MATRRSMLDVRSRTSPVLVRGKGSVVRSVVIPRFKPRRRFVRWYSVSEGLERGCLESLNLIFEAV